MTKSSRPNLIYSSVGDSSVHQSWIMSDERNYDLCLVYYGDQPGRFSEHAEIYVARKGTKTQNLSYLLDFEREKIQSYQNIFYLDDDILIDPTSLNLFFEIFNRYGLLVAQPAFTINSDTTWDIVRAQRGNLLRYTNFVEIGAVLFKASILSKIEGLFRESVSGWGVDLLLSKFLGHPRDKIAVIDAITCFHPKRLGPSEMDNVMPRKEHLQEGKALYRRHTGQETFEFKEYGRIALNEHARANFGLGINMTGLPNFSYLRLEEEFRRNNFESLWSFFLNVFQYFLSHQLISVPESIVNYIRHFIRAFLKYYEDPAFPVSQQKIVVLMAYNAIIANMLALTNEENTDRLIERLKRVGLIERVFPLYSALNQKCFSVDELFQFNQELASLWYMHYFDLYTSAIGDKLGFENLRSHLECFNDKLDPRCSVISRVYYACSYIDPILDRPLKNKINTEVQKHLPSNIEFGDEYFTKRIAVFSACWRNSHAVYKNQCYFLESLRDDYELTFFPLHDQYDSSMFHKLDLACLRGQLHPESIQRGRFHMAYFPDVGMDEGSIILANSRIAPVQVACFGHSVSTFGAQVDYYIVGQKIEDLSKYSENYSERVLAIPGLGIVNKIPSYEKKGKVGVNHSIVIGIPAAGHKLNYPYLIWLKEILAFIKQPVKIRIFGAGAATRFLGLPITQRNLVMLLQVEEVELYPHLDYEKYLELLEQCDLALDTFHYGGCNGVVDCLWTGVPVLTCCGSRWYNRVGPKQLENIGLQELIAGDQQEYVSKAVRLISDPTYRDQLREKIKSIDLKESVLFDHNSVPGFKKAIDYLMNLTAVELKTEVKTPVLIK